MLLVLKNVLLALASFGVLLLIVAGALSFAARAPETAFASSLFKGGMAVLTLSALALVYVVGP
jgi:hypothetical protein